MSGDPQKLIDQSGFSRREKGPFTFLERSRFCEEPCVYLSEDACGQVNSI